jgi:nicotinamidase-related amidase
VVGLIGLGLMIGGPGVDLIAAASSGEAEDQSRTELSTPSTALLVIDIQEFYFEGGAIPLEGSVEAAKAAGRVIRAFRAAGLPVIHVQHLPAGQDEPGQDVQPAYRIRPEVAPGQGELVIGKHHASSFRETELLQRLRGLEIERLVIVGMQTHMCVEAATRAAADLGFEVTVVHDACATRQLSFGGVTAPAAQVHASTLASLEGSYARIVGVEELVAEIGGTTEAAEASAP